MLRVVERGLQKGELIENDGAESGDLLLYGAGELAQRAGQCLSALRGDHVHDRLGLRKIDPPAQKRPLGEFSRFGGTGAGAERALQDLPHYERTSVAVDLHGILGRIGMRPLHIKHQALVDHTVFIHNMAVVDGAGLPGRDRMPQVPGPENVRKNANSFRPRNPDDPDA